MDWVLLGVLLLVSLGTLFVVTDVELGVVAPPNCDVVPQDFQCVCSLGFEKHRTTNGFVCSEVPELPIVIFPIDSWGEARAYAKEKIGVDCVSPNFLDDNNVPLSHSVGSYVLVECLKQTSETAGSVVWRTDFNSADGFVWRIQCDNINYPECPPNFEFVPEEPVLPDVTDYFCDETSYYEFLQGFISFSRESDGSVIYPDSFNYNTQLPVEDIRLKAEQACNDVFGDPVFPYVNRTKFGWVVASSFSRVVCSIYRTDGAQLGAWGFDFLDHKWLVPQTSYRSEDGKTIWQSGFGFVETGVCFRK